MLSIPPVPALNQLISTLPHKERGRILDSCDIVELAFGTILCEANQPFRYVYFPCNGFISLVATVTNHPPLEMGLIGNEGMLGSTLVLDINAVPLRAVVQGSGSTLRMAVPQFRRALRETPVLLRTLKRYLYVTMVQLAQTASCTHFHEVEPRLARWLLMTHDCAHADHFHLTHQFLADMLGVQRSAVTIAAGTLQKRKIIHYIRGEISIIDRKGLEATSCECYEKVKENYTRLFNKH